MTAKPGAHAYKQTGIKTATRGQLLIMLYESAIQHLRKASVAIDAKDLSAKGLAIGKTHDILNELMNTLNHEVGGEISQNLERLYAFMIEQLIAANTAGMTEDEGSTIARLYGEALAHTDAGDLVNARGNLRRTVAFRPSMPELAIALGITSAHAQAVYDDIRNKRRTTKYLHMAPVLAGDVPELD